MNRAIGTVAALVVVVSVVVTLAAAPGGAVAGNETTTDVDQPTLDELQATGDRPAGAPPSIRAAGTYEEFAVKYLPTGLWVDESEDSPSWRYLEPGDQVKRDSVQVWSKRGYGVDSKDVKIRVAHYRPETREGPNGTRERVAENVTTYTVDATLGGGYTRVDVDLRSHYQQSYRTVVCVQDPGEPDCLTNPNGVRWQFEHQTSAAMQSVPIDSEGDLLAWGIGFQLLPFFVSALGNLYGARVAIKRAKSAPNLPWWIWPVVVLGGSITIFVFWDSLVATLVRAPWALSMVLGSLLGLVAAVWFGDSRKRSLFFRLRPDEWVDTLGGDASDTSGPADDGDDGDLDDGDGGLRPGRAPTALVADAIPVATVHGANGERHPIAPGLWAWLARARGAVTTMKAKRPDGDDVDGDADADADDGGDGSSRGTLQTRIEVENGPYEEVFVLDPEADDDDVIDHEPERHDWQVPKVVWKDEDGWHLDSQTLLGGALGFMVASLGGELLLANAKLGILLGAVGVALWKFATPVEGKLEVALANIHYTRALPSVLTHSEEIADAADKTELFDRWQGEKMDNKISSKEMDDRRDRSQMGRIVERYTSPSDADSDGRGQGVPSDDD